MTPIACMDRLGTLRKVLLLSDDPLHLLPQDPSAVEG